MVMVVMVSYAITITIPDVKQFFEEGMVDMDMT